MSSINPIQNNNLPLSSSDPTRLDSAAQSGAIGAQSLSATTSMTSSTSVSMVAMQQQVGSFLSNVDAGLANNETLKMLIALMVMSALLNGNDNGNAQANQGALQALENLSGGTNTAMYISLETATNTVQTQNQSISLDTATGINGLSQQAFGGEGTSTGGEMDVTA